MEVATIVPQNMLGLIENDKYLMCLAHLIGRPEMRHYTQFYQAKCMEDGAFVIMDNGLIEGDPRPFQEVYEKAYQLGADEVILPDVFRDAQKTKEAVEAAMKLPMEAGGPQLMVVPQGNTVTEWAECAAYFIRTYGHQIATIGVPKVLVHLGGRDGRMAAIQELLNICPIARHKKFHLLGCWTTPLEITVIDKVQHTESNQWPVIRGVDSAIAYVYARAGKKITSQDRPDSNPINFERDDETRLLLLKSNIRQWRKAADSSPRRWF